ncbi:MAG: helix-turn-helix transcriptional regulator, partial [Bacteroidetes bacterium]|nr:helix-turn-helix transcriptional regulator [Bacteroidota bacterium]
MIELNNRKYTCPVDVTLGLIGGKWKILILSHLHQFGDRSFSQIRDNLPGVSEKMLIQQLKEMCVSNLVEKKILSAKPYRVEYFLTDFGR